MDRLQDKFDRLIGKEDTVVLGIESSCDETAAAVTCGRKVLSNIVASQVDIHSRFGGVVPEIASRNHTLSITTVIDQALKNAGKTLNDIDVIAVTSHPGLIGSLLVGVSTAKAISLCQNIPLVSVNHIEAHICANYVGTDLKPPFLSLVASGGHTSIIRVDGYNDYHLVGSTTDDAIGEAFDKVARLLGLPYPGGPNVDRLAAEGDDSAIDFMRVRRVQSDFSLSYSGLKTAVVNYIHNKNQKGEDINIKDVCASFSRTAVDMLVSTVVAAAKSEGIKTLAVAGGVASNSYLRQALKAIELNVLVPDKDLCTDNAVMVAIRGFYSAYEGKNLAGLDLNASSNYR